MEKIKNVIRNEIKRVPFTSLSSWTLEYNPICKLCFVAHTAWEASDMDPPLWLPWLCFSLLLVCMQVSRALRCSEMMAQSGWIPSTWKYDITTLVLTRKERDTRCHKAAAFDCTGVWQRQQGKEKGKNDKEAGNQTSTGTEMCLTHWDTLHQTATFAFLKPVFLNIPIYYLSSDWYQD